MQGNFNTVDAAIADIRDGGLVIILDAADREAEGDFIGAAACATPEVINFMVTHARGAFIAVFMPAGRCATLGIDPMVMSSENNSINRTQFRVAVDAASARSGSSAGERADAVRLLADPAAVPSDLVKPGHVVPIESHEGGLFARQGHTEAGVELVRLAGFDPAAAVDLEILDEDGSMAGHDRLFELAHRFDLKILHVQDVIRYIAENAKPPAANRRPA